MYSQLPALASAEASPQATPSQSVAASAAASVPVPLAVEVLGAVEVELVVAVDVDVGAEVKMEVAVEVELVVAALPESEEVSAVPPSCAAARELAELSHARAKVYPQIARLAYRKGRCHIMPLLQASE